MKKQSYPISIVDSRQSVPIAGRKLSDNCVHLLRVKSTCTPTKGDLAMEDGRFECGLERVPKEVVLIRFSKDLKVMLPFSLNPIYYVSMTIGTDRYLRAYNNYLQEVLVYPNHLHQLRTDDTTT